MTVPRLREQCRPPSPPDRRPPAGFARLAVARRGLVRSARALAAAACLALVGSLALPATATAQASVLVTNLNNAELVLSLAGAAHGRR